jgi:crotonobetainyl-CoA:carnitine CoA-transferase CaiB-like acyl-CoA transferase
VLDTQELIDEPSFYERGILQRMTHGERNMVMPTWPVRFLRRAHQGRAGAVVGEHTTEVLSDWLGLDAAAIAQLRWDGIV